VSAGAQGRRGAAAVTVAVVLVVLGCAGPVEAPARQWYLQAYAFEAPAGDVAAAYLTITNQTADTMVLDSVTSDAAPLVSAHTQRTDGGLVSMVPVERIAVAPHDSLVQRPGGDHLMLEGVARALVAGDTIALTLWFRGRPTATLGAIVRPYGS
jgi:copper(I)-binding protein